MGTETHGEAHGYWLTRTKLQPPRLPEDVVPRQRLLSDLHDAVLSHALTLVSAPAGYGKTTLLGTLPHAFSDLSIAWLSLDQEDNEPASFLAGVVVALQHAVPGCATVSQALLHNLPNPGAEARRVVGALVNDILEAAPNPLILILEDLHLIAEPTVYVALDYLLEHLPPQMHLVVSARHDPPLALARLRARGQLAAVHLRNLRFTVDEASAFLNDRLRLDLTREELATLHTGTEGWAAGLRLLAGSLDQIPTSAGRAAFVAQLAKTNTYVFDFLADEVLSHQSDAVRSFLLETSILPELSPRLCQAVTGRSDAAAVLEDIYRRNLFVVAADETGPSEGRIYRYHQLFAEFLRRRLAQSAYGGPDRVAELHRRAAEAEVVPARAIPHLLAASAVGGWDQAVEMLEQVGEQFLRDGLFHTLRAWIEALPATIQDAHPRLLYLLGVSALQRGALHEAQSLLERARHGFEAVGDAAGQGLCALELVSVANSALDFERQAELTKEALGYPLPPHGRVQLLMALAWQAENERGDWSQVEANVDQAMRITLESGDVQAFNVLASQLRVDLTLMPKGPERLERYCRQVLARFGEGTGLIQAGAHSLLGLIHFLQGRLEEAVQQAEHARAISERLGGFAYLDAEVAIVLSYASVARGDYGAAESRWEALVHWAEQTPALAHWVVPFLHLVGRAQWLQGAVDRARQTHERMRSFVDAPVPEVAFSRALLCALLEIGDGRHADAERTLRPMLAVEQEVRQCILYGSARLLLAYLYLKASRPRDALSEFIAVLEEHERRGSPGLILKEAPPIVVPLLQLAVDRGIHVSFVLRLLDLFGAGAERRRAYVPDTGETLSSRELEVLRLVADGASNRAIAERLVITERTSKNHVTNILRKLNVQSRTHAVSRARALRIV